MYALLASKPGVAVRSGSRLTWILLVWLGLILLWLIGGFANGGDAASPVVMIGLAVGFWGFVLIGIVWFVSRLTAPLEKQACPRCGSTLQAGATACERCGNRLAERSGLRHNA